jgi:hypothetical protein
VQTSQFYLKHIHVNKDAAALTISLRNDGKNGVSLNNGLDQKVFQNFFGGDASLIGGAHFDFRRHRKPRMGIGGHGQKHA